MKPNEELSSKWKLFARHRRLVLYGFASMLMVVALAVGGRLFASWSRTLPPQAAVLEHARAGVSRNSDWQPVIRRLEALDMALVPAGCFTMGSTTPQLAEAMDSCERFYGSGKCQVPFVQSETPLHEVCFDHPFWIGETEVTNREYGSSSSTDMRSMYRGPSWPRETITWQEASEFCMARDARLPTEAEWEYAARGPDGLTYPWGDEFQLERLTSGRLNPDNVAFAPAGASWVGVFDMSGGIAEWVADWYAPYPQTGATNLQGLADGQGRVIRGGSWASFASFLVRTSYRESASPDTANSTIGFRCARDLDY
jgi:formylglycine-generating enzyme required for sulfatase activity